VRDASETQASSPDLVAKQVEKLTLEIEVLRKQNEWWPRFVQAAPLIVAALGLGGLAFTIYQFQSGQKKDRSVRELDQRSRLQNQMRTDIDQVLQFPCDRKQTVSRVSFLLRDIKTVLESQVNAKQTVVDFFPLYERRLTESLVKLVRDDCDFQKPRDVGLANTVIDYWDDYSSYLKTDLKKLDYILYEYIRALQALRYKNPGYLESLKLATETGGYDVPPQFEEKDGEAILYNHFIDISAGFKRHLEILGNEQLSEEEVQLKNSAASEFQDALSNAEISRHVLRGLGLNLDQEQPQGVSSREAEEAARKAP
jgi:hypothetical protein